MAAALVAGAAIFANDLNRYAKGQIGMGGLAFSALGLIPGGRGIVRVTRLGREVGILGRALTRPGGARILARSLYRGHFTRPTGPRGGLPTGTRTKINPRQDAEVTRSLQRENESADLLADHGYHTHQNPTREEVVRARHSSGDTGDPEKNPDYLVENRVFDHYAAGTGKSVRNIWSEVESKVADGQTQRVVVNLRDWGGNMGALREQFANWPVAGLKEVKVITSGGIVSQILLP